MFAKPYKLKSNNTLKNSEKKHLIQRVQEEFPQASEEKIKEIVSVKSTCICMKLVLHSGETVNVYAVEGTPMIIEQEQGLVPTVCALWKVPDLVPTLTIHSPVLPKVLGGAPLYLPGVVIPEAGAGFPMFQRGSIIAMCTNDNSAAGIVGRATMSSADMLLRTAGVCLETLHVVGDQLCKDERLAQVTRPREKPPVCQDITNVTTQLTQLQLNLKPERDEWPTLGKRVPPAPNEPRLIPASTPPHAHNTQTHQQDTKASTEDVQDTPQTEQPLEENSDGVEGGAPEDMEGLLQWCLLGFLKKDGKHIELPIKTSLLYRNYLIPLCPAGRTLDVKKSSYKKMSKFLEAMQQEGLIEVREIEKGVDAVVAVQPSHPLVRAHVAPSPPSPPSHPSLTPTHTYHPPQVREMYCVTAAVVDLFAPVKKGTALTPAEVRSTLTEYVRGRGLARDSGALALDRLLAAILQQPEQACVKWEPVMSGVQARMTPATEMTFSDGSTVLSKAKLEPIAMNVVTRSGNKKVTLVSNLESFGFRLGELSSECQRAVAAACGVSRAPGAKADQLMLQGDQTHFMAKLLIEKYGLPKKFVEGADKALKKKK